MNRKIPILLLTKDRPNLLEKVFDRLIKYTDWNNFELWVLDNFSTSANKKIIGMYKDNYPFINVYATTYSQLALIQNEIIGKLKADFYIKIDDDILVGEGWTDGFVGVYERHHNTMAFGSVIIPINGFGWVPYLEIMGWTEEFKEKFPGTKLNQDCMDVAVYKDKLVNEFIWKKSLNLDETVRRFKERQNGEYKDLFCPHRYSIGAIVFSHKRWEEMGGWKVQEYYDLVLKKQKRYNKIADMINKWKKMPANNKKWNLAADVISGATQGYLGYEELAVYNWSRQKGYTIPVTTQSLVFHFSFGPVDQYLMNKVYQKIVY